MSENRGLRGTKSLPSNLHARAIVLSLSPMGWKMRATVSCQVHGCRIIPPLQEI